LKKGAFTREKTNKIVISSRGKKNYYGVKTYKIESLTFKTKDLCWLLGLWLAEGSYGFYYKGEPLNIQISQSPKSTKRLEIEKRLKQMGLKFSTSKDGKFVINSCTLVKYFWEDLGLQNVHSDTKFIPKFFKELAPQYLYELFMGYMLGDGCYHKNQWVATTVSKRLADDLQEIIHKMGLVANIKIKKTKGSLITINGKTYQRKYDQYVLSTRHQEVYTTCFHRNIEKEYYDGIVWDVSVADNESLMVRRNGKVFISSNCRRYGYNCIFTELSTLPSAGYYFEKLLREEDIYDPKECKRFGASFKIFRVAEFGQPREKIKSEDIILPEGFYKDIWLLDVKKTSKGLETSNYGYDIAVVTGAGETLVEAFQKAYENTKKIVFDGYHWQLDMVLSKNYKNNILERFEFVKEYFSLENINYSLTQEQSSSIMDELLRKIQEI